MKKSDEQTPFLTPTYQSMFMMDLSEVNKCFFNRDYIGSFEALRILYSDLLEKPKEMIKEEWEEFLKQKSQIIVMGGSITRTSVRMEAKIDKFLYKEIPKIKAKFISVLEKCDLLNLDLTVKPRIQHKKRAVL